MSPGYSSNPWDINEREFLLVVHNLDTFCARAERGRGDVSVRDSRPICIGDIGNSRGSHGVSPAGSLNYGIWRAFKFLRT